MKKPLIATIAIAALLGPSGCAAVSTGSSAAKGSGGGSTGATSAPIIATMPSATPSATATSTPRPTATPTSKRASSSSPGSGASHSSSAPAGSPSTSSPASSAPPSSSGATCVKTAGGRCGYSSYASIVGASSDPYVDQNIWSGNSSYKQTLYATNPGYWHVVANANTNFGGVLTYPNTGFNMSGSVGSYSSITSSFSTTIPHNSHSAGWAAYDLWFNNWNDEVMIQTDIGANSYYDCTAKTSATINGQPWHMCVFGAERVWKPGTNDQNLQNRTSGSLNIQAFLTWMEQHGYLPSGSSWTAGSYGFEICDTGGTNEIYQVNSFSWIAKH